MSSLPQHSSTTKIGKGGFAVSFYVLLLLKRNYCASQSANCAQGLQDAVYAELARDAQAMPAIFVPLCVLCL
jgi:hypothetical protein